MRKIFTLIYSLCFSVLLLPVFSYAADEGYAIKNYHTDIQLNTDASMDVIEDIDVTFSLSSHGIFREIPTRDQQGYFVSIVDWNVVGAPIASNTISNGYYTLKIGDPNITLRGDKNYTIQYTVENAIKDYAPDVDGNFTSGGQIVSTGNTAGWEELYWNIIGNKRGTTVSNVTATITLPKVYTFSPDTMFVVRGPEGANYSGGVQFSQNGNTITIRLDRTLQPREGLTIGLKFPVGYFSFPSDYNDTFTTFIPNSNSTTSKPLSIWDKIGSVIGGIFPFLIWIFIFIFIKQSQRGRKMGTKPAWKSEKAITPYYVPPKNIDPQEAFWFWYNDKNPNTFTALLYYWATQGFVSIELREGTKGLFGIKGKDTYHIIKKDNPQGQNQTPLAQKLLSTFFSILEIKDGFSFFKEQPSSLEKSIQTQTDIELNSSSYQLVEQLLTELQTHMDLNSTYYTITKKFIGKKYTLTATGEQLFEEMRGFQDYLKKVEDPVLQQELKNNPDFFNKILPWAVLFGTQTKLLKVAEQIWTPEQLGQMTPWYHSYNGHIFNAAMFSAMNSGIQENIMPPRSSSSSGGSGFGGGGGFSGGGGGGGGGGRR